MTFRKKMPNEIKAELSIVTMRFTRTPASLRQGGPIFAFANTKIPGEVRAKYFREEGNSTVQADVHVDATGDSSFELQAIVRVKLTYDGDMVRPSEQTRKMLGDRLQELAQRYCADVVQKEIAETVMPEEI
jgi:hypothetical protein